MSRSEPEDGSARLQIVNGVALLYPEDAVFEGMIAGWSRQQLARGLKKSTIDDRQSSVRQFMDFAGAYPWRWTAVMMDDWSAELVGAKGLAVSTVRQRQGDVRLFCDYITSRFYDWPEVCEERFGTHPIQVCHEWNTTRHLEDHEGKPGRRALTREECQALFDYADDRVEHALRRGRKGAVTAYRDATILKTLYGWGLRVNEASRLELVDLHRNPAARELGRFAALNVRWGKSSRGSTPKRRLVLTIMPWAAEALEDYVVNIRPRCRGADGSALWLSERGRQLRPWSIEHTFAEYRDALGLDSDLTPHSLRHSYVTHSIEDGVDPTFIQHQAGHEYASTTAIYTGVSGDFMNTMMRGALNRALTTANQ